MKKRILSLILALIMIISLFPASAFAEKIEAETVEEGDLIDNKTAVEKNINIQADEIDIANVPCRYNVSGFVRKRMRGRHIAFLSV